jgi:formate-dependent phosphoribosylglycinamide formyltransferase (GAR transformylase)
MNSQPTYPHIAAPLISASGEGSLLRIRSAPNAHNKTYATPTGKQRAVDISNNAAVTGVVRIINITTLLTSALHPHTRLKTPIIHRGNNHRGINVKPGRLCRGCRFSSRKNQ